MVEHQLPKLSVVGSIPIARSKLHIFRWQDSRTAVDFASQAFLLLIFLFDRPRHTG